VRSVCKAPGLHDPESFEEHRHRRP
jgi:hypothetical protein